MAIEKTTEIRLGLYQDFEELLYEQIPDYKERLEKILRGELINLLLEAHEKSK